MPGFKFEQYGQRGKHANYRTFLWNDPDPRVAVQVMPDGTRVRGYFTDNPITGGTWVAGEPPARETQQEN